MEENVKGMRRKAAAWEKTFAKGTSDTELSPRMLQELLKLKNKKTARLIKGERPQQTASRKSDARMRIGTWKTAPGLAGAGGRPRPLRPRPGGAPGVPCLEGLPGRRHSEGPGCAHVARWGGGRAPGGPASDRLLLRGWREPSPACFCFFPQVENNPLGGPPGAGVLSL